MDGKQLLLALDFIDDSLIAEASEEKPLRRQIHPGKWIALAAGLTIVVAAVLAVPNILRPEMQPESVPGIVAPVESTQAAAESENAQTVPDGAVPEAGGSAAIRIDRDDIHVNQPMEQTAGAIKLDDYTRIEWDADDIRAYFGRDLTPAYIPAGLTPDENNGRAYVYQKADGTLAYDTVSVRYGSIAPTGEAAAPEGFVLTAYKVGSLSDCVYVLPGEDEIRTSDIAGTGVTIGYREMCFGPYDPETHAPSGTYPMYVLQFALDDVHYDITTASLSLDDAVRIAASVITGSAAVEIVD